MGLWSPPRHIAARCSYQSLFTDPWGPKALGARRRSGPRPRLRSGPGCWGRPWGGRGCRSCSCRGRRRWSWSRGSTPSRRLDRNHHGRSCLEVADRRIGTLRRLIGIESEVIQCAPTNRVRVLILQKRFGVPSYGIGRLSDSPGRAAVTVVVKRTIVWPARLLRRRVKSYIA